MDQSEVQDPSDLCSHGKFDNLLKAFDIRDDGNSPEKTENGVMSPDRLTSPKTSQKDDNLASANAASEDHSALNNSITSVSSDSPGCLKIDEGVSPRPQVSKQAPDNLASVRRSRQSSAKALPVPVVSIKEEKEDLGYMKNVITITTPSAVVTTSLPATSVSLLTGNVVSKANIVPTQSAGVRLAAKSLIGSTNTQLKIAPRPPSQQQPGNPTKFTFIPTSTSNPRGQGGKTVTLYVPPNLLTPSGSSGALRLPSPQSLMELLSRSGQAITSRAAVRPVTQMQNVSVNQAGLINPKPRISSQVSVPRLPAPSAPAPLGQASTSSAATAMTSSAIAKEALTKMLTRDKFPPHRITMPPAHLSFGTVTKHICACGDEFLSAANLESHIARKSAFIRVICPFCNHNQNQVFLNPCALVFHIQTHKKTHQDFLKTLVSCQMSPIGKRLPTPQIPLDEELIDLSNDLDAHQKSPEKTTSQVPRQSKEPAVSEVQSKLVIEAVQTDKPTEKNVKTPPAPSNDALAPVLQDNPADTTVYNIDDEDEAPKAVAVANLEDDKYDSCPYCKVILDKGSALELHFQSAQQTPPEELQEYLCSQCNRQLPNRCSFQAHQAFHNKTRPFICPECGETIYGSMETYVRHVQDRCMHNMHFLRFGCTKCPKKKKKFSTRKQLLEHIENHGETYVKCLHCPMAFRSIDTLKDHCSKAHTISEVSDTDYKSIFKCAMCDTVYQEAEQRRTHLITHSKDLRVFLIYRCNKMNCGANRIFITKVRIREHLSTAHSLDVLIHLCNYCGQDFETPDSLTEHLKSHSNPNECVLCHESCSNQEALWKHMAMNHDTNVTKPNIDVPGESKSPVGGRKRCSSDPATSPAAKRVKSPPYVPSCQVEAAEDSRFYCSACKLKFLRQGVLQEHMRIVHSVKPQFPCHLCGATYDSHSKLQKHLKQHEGKAKEQTFFTCWICTKNKSVKTSKYTKRSVLEKHLTSYHKINKGQIDWSNLKSGVSQSDGSDAEGEGSRDAEVADDDEPIKRLKVDGESQFTCAKCTFVCEDRAEFLSHIPQHKTEDESHQCQECGMSFMVLPSLKRHLLVVHRIRDFMKYFQESGLNLETPPVEEKQRSFRPRFPQNGNGDNKLNKPQDTGDIDIPDDFECKVCYKQFDSEKALHNHMRVHGMAFIRSKRMDSI